MNQDTKADEDFFGAAPTAQEQLKRWDEGRSIWTISMGGLGPSYEQAIQVLAIEIVRDQLGKPQYTRVKDEEHEDMKVASSRKRGILV